MKKFLPLILILSNFIYSHFAYASDNSILGVSICTYSWRGTVEDRPHVCKEKNEREELEVTIISQSTSHVEILSRSIDHSYSSRLIFRKVLPPYEDDNGNALPGKIVYDLNFYENKQNKILLEQCMQNAYIAQSNPILYKLAIKLSNKYDAETFNDQNDANKNIYPIESCQLIRK